VKAGAAARRAQRLNVTRRTRAFVPLCCLNVVLAMSRWTPVRSVHGLTASL